MSSPPCVLVVADPGRIAELATALGDPFPQGVVDVLLSTGGDDTIDLFESRSPRVVVLTASLDVGDAKSLIETLRDMRPREELSIVLVGDDAGPIRNALDAIDMKPDRFVSRPLSTKALRFAVQSGLEMVARAVGEPGTSADADDNLAVSRSPTPLRGSSTGTGPASVIANPAGSNGAAAANNNKNNGLVRPTGSNGHARDSAATLEGESPAVARATTDRGTGIQPPPEAEGAPVISRSVTDRGLGLANALPGMQLDEEPDEGAKRAALRARWEALADSIGDDALDDDLLDDGESIETRSDAERRGESFEAAFDELSSEEAAPLPPPIEIGPRRKTGTNPDFHPVPPMVPWRPGTTSELREEPDLRAPPREPTLILHDEPPRMTGPLGSPPAMPPGMDDPLQTASTASTIAPDAPALPDPPRERWSHPVLLSELIDRSRDSSRELLAHVTGSDDLAGLDELDDDIVAGNPQHTPPPHVLHGGHLKALEDLVEPDMPAEATRPRLPARSEPEPPPGERPGGRDFARQLRAKMSMMAQRLFQSDTAAPPPELGPRHDHHTEIDLAALGEEPALGGGVTEISRSRTTTDARELSTTSPGSWDTQAREKGLPDSGEIVRGVSDAAIVLARMFTQTFTGRVGFRKEGVEKVVFVDQGRPVFASSNEQGDRMGELLVREGKITASQYERCQVHVEQSGRRMGEILVDFGYLKRRELLPAVRRHVEDIIYSLFGWDRGHYHVTPDPLASAERIRLSRHPASLILEGIRRKLDRSTLEKVLGASATVVEVVDREKVASVINTGDLAQEERAALAAFDGQADLAHVARTVGVDVADVLPFAWGLCVLGLAIARRTEADVIEESTALVGETDLAIDRDRVRARWQLVTDADYFALLGVRRDATGFEIRRAYQAARRDFAADCFPTDLRRELARELEDISSVLDEAFRVLRDDRLRQTYLANLIE